MKNKVNKPITSVNSHLGSPVFMINGQPFMKPVFETYVPETRYFREFADAGCHVYSFSTNLADGFGSPLWIAQDKWDFSELDARAHRVLEADIDGLIMPRILLSTPLWWREQNPDEFMVLDNGEKAYPRGKPSVTPVERTFESIASEKWRRDMTYGLRCVIEHIQESDYADNMFGYMITGLMTEEWYHWSSGMTVLGDYSVHYVRRFREWLKGKYVSADRLQRAWNNPKVDFNSIEIPSRMERFDDPKTIFRNTEKQMNVIDFYQFHNEMIPDTIDYFAKIIKGATESSQVVGAFYGFMFEFCGYFSHPQLLNEIKKLYILLDESKHYDKSSCSQVLIVGDELSCNYVVFPRNRNGMGWWSELLSQTFMQPQPSFYKFGAPHDSILVDDLELVNIDQYKLIIFLNTYNLTDRQRALINNRIKQKGRIILWCYAPGLFNGSKASAEAMEELTGIKIVPSEDETFIAPKITLSDVEHPILNDMKYAGFTVIGPENKSCKLFSVEDDEAMALGRLPGTDDITLAYKDIDGWTSIYAITPALPPEFYRSLAKYAGVHIYNDKSDTLYASKSYLTICADKEGLEQ